MRVIHVRNVHEALPLALELLNKTGVKRPSRNGPVLLGPSVTTVYERPCERVLFYPERDANPYFHLYESLWMLAGRNDVAGPVRYAKQIREYSDDGVTLNGAYGDRWRKRLGRDQLPIIAEALKADPDNRRCVLQMWWQDYDLGRPTKDACCNTLATFQIVDGALNLTVFCRSNDVIWGCYGANAVHFSFLLEYMSLWIGVPVGTYAQVSVNWHGYLNTLEVVKDVQPGDNPYIDGRVHADQMFHCSIEKADERIKMLLFDADSNFVHPRKFNDDEPFFNAAYSLLTAHDIWRNHLGADRYKIALDCLRMADAKNDWITAGREWLERRYTAWQKKQ